MTDEKIDKRRTFISREAEQDLHDLYYNQKQMWGRDRLWKLARSKGIDVSRRHVMQWLKKQQVNQLFTRPEKQKTLVRPTIMRHTLSQVAIDLVDMQRYAFGGYRYILTAIDLYSKYAWAEALENKQENTVLDAMKKIIKGMRKKPSSIRSDNGSEFTNKKFKDYLKSEGIKQIFSLPSRPSSNGGIERLNQTLKKLIRMNVKASGDKNWHTYLQQLVDNYNSTYQRTIKASPDDIHSQDKEQPEITKNIMKASKTRDDRLLKKGQKVRVKLEKRSQDGTYWTKNIYTISQVMKPKDNLRAPQYKLEGQKEIYYNHDLLPIDGVENESDDPEMFEVSKLIRPSIQTRDKKKVQGYIVRWKNYGPKDDTFEPREKLMEDVSKVVNQFEKKHNVEWDGDDFYWDQGRKRPKTKSKKKPKQNIRPRATIREGLRRSTRLRNKGGATESDFVDVLLDILSKE